MIHGLLAYRPRLHAYAHVHACADTYAYSYSYSYSYAYSYGYGYAYSFGYGYAYSFGYGYNYSLQLQLQLRITHIPTAPTSTPMATAPCVRRSLTLRRSLRRNLRLFLPAGTLMPQLDGGSTGGLGIIFAHPTFIDLVVQLLVDGTDEWFALGQPQYKIAPCDWTEVDVKVRVKVRVKATSSLGLGVDEG